ncbi:MAG TPA: BNR-4 repeat-containing protein, partial [Devosia sp.]|nr:BNR-4 repeat-containing protein [Devosia sp.]
TEATKLKPPFRLDDDMAWCWWTRPRATRIGEDIYFAALDHEGGMIAARYNLESETVQRSKLAQFEDDDHNNPALLAVPGKPLVCFYSRHDAEEGLRYRISAEPLSPRAWQPEQTLTFGGSTTYAQVHDVGGTLHLFTRVDETRWGWCMSSDWAQTWSRPRDFLAFETDQQVYMATALLSDGKTMRVAVSGHPKEYEKKPLHDVWACVVDLETGAVTLPSSGKEIGNLISGARMPLNYSDLEMVQKTAANRTINLFDVSSGPVFEIGYVSKIKDDMATRDGWHHVASLRNGSWLIENIAPTGRKFGYIDAGFYVGSIAFPERAAPGQLYLTREADGLWHFEYWQRRDDGRWSATPLAAPGSQRLARPWPVTPPVSKLGAVALALEDYADDSYYGSLSHLVGAALPAGYKP